MMKIAAVVLSGGSGKRLGGQIPKQYIEVAGRPVLGYALKAFEESRVDEVCLVCAGEYISLGKKISLEFKKVSRVVPGGAERFDSVKAGLEALEGESPDYVLIHDGARPYITALGINKMIDAAASYGAAVAACRSTDTIKIADEEGCIKESPAREYCFQVQTPQCFKFTEILEAYRMVSKDSSITDDASVYGKAFAGRKIKLVDIGEENSKITTPSDLEIMRFRLES